MRSEGDRLGAKGPGFGGRLGARGGRAEVPRSHFTGLTAWALGCLKKPQDGRTKTQKPSHKAVLFA